MNDFRFFNDTRYYCKDHMRLSNSRMTTVLAAERETSMYDPDAFRRHFSENEAATAGSDGSGVTVPIPSR